MKKFARIIGTGSYLPPRIITNIELEKTLDTTDEWITSRTGIKERRVVDDQSTCDLALEASRKALEMAEMKASEIDLVILATTTPDKIFPATATMLQDRIGASCPAFDIQAVCAGFVFALTTAQQYIENGVAKNILVVGSETMSKIVDWNDRSTAILFGDGAGAVVLSASSTHGIISSHIHADGIYNDLLNVQNNYIQMKGNEVFKIAVNTLGSLVDETLDKNNMKKKDIDWLIPHQANLRIIKATAKKLSMPMDQVVVTIDKHGNTSAASIPLALNEAVKDGRIKDDQVILLEAFGSGFTWGSVLLRY